jgi:hypothetical protein
MWKFDKPYVREMMKDGFDAHLDLAVHAGAITDDQRRDYSSSRPDLVEIRSRYKTVNYGCVYGAGGTTIARSAGISKKEGDKLVEAYWKRNWAVKAIPKTITTKTEFGVMWLFNPVSKLWYSLRAEKDIFSTLNQGTGAYCFDTWVKYIRSKRPQLTAQFHDEVILCIKKSQNGDYRTQCGKLLKWAIQMANKELKLNRQLDIDVQFGENYSEIH